MAETDCGLLSHQHLDSGGGRKGRKTETQIMRGKNHFLNFAVDLLFEFYIHTSTLASAKQQVQTADGSYRSHRQTHDTSATGYMSLNFKDGQQQRVLCPGVVGQREFLNSEDTYRLCYFHLGTQSRPPFQLHFRSLNTDFFLPSS